MTTRVFVPVTDDMMETLDGRNTPLVPYHPDRPCWRLDATGPDPSTRHAGSHLHPNPANGDLRLQERRRLEARRQPPAPGRTP